MWLTVDIGNSNIKGGVFNGVQLARTFRIPLKDAVDPDGLAASLAKSLNGVRIERAGICSVVPALTPTVQSAVMQSAGVKALVIGTGMALPIALDYETPQTLGTDRLAAAVAGWLLFGSTSRPARPVVVIDAGTAVTFEVVDHTARYLGGTIAPGPALMLTALNRGTAQLPLVPLEVPEQVVGRSTREAIQSGLMFSFVDSVHCMLERIRNTLDREPLVIATGGWSTVLRAHVRGIYHVEPDLVLHGIRILMEQPS